MEAQCLTTDYRFKLNANNIVLTEVKEWIGDYTVKPRDIQHENLKHNLTKGILSAKSRKRLKSAVNWLIVSSQYKPLYTKSTAKKYKFKVNFITLTIPPQEQEQIDEKTFKETLNTFLTYHRKYSNLNNYVWKIESHKDGRFHVHLTTDTFIHYQSIRNSWNTILQRYGMLAYHFAKYQNYAPPSTEIKSVKKIRSLGAYISKYLSKNNEENPKFRGRVWGCSRKISRVLDNKTLVSPDLIGQTLRPLFDSDIKEIYIETEPNVFGNTYRVATIFLLNVKDWVKIKGSYLYNLFEQIVTFLRAPSARQTKLAYI